MLNRSLIEKGQFCAQLWCEIQKIDRYDHHGEHWVGIDRKYMERIILSIQHAYMYIKPIWSCPLCDQLSCEIQNCDFCDPQVDPWGGGTKIHGMQNVVHTPYLYEVSC